MRLIRKFYPKGTLSVTIKSGVTKNYLRGGAMRLLIFMITSLVLTGCATHYKIHNDPPFKIPESVLADIPKPPATLKVNRDGLEYCAKNIYAACNSKLYYIRRHIPSFNDITQKD